MTEIVYKGPHREGVVPGVGVFERNKPIDVTESVAEELLKSSEFELVEKSVEVLKSSELVEKPVAPPKSRKEEK